MPDFFSLQLLLATFADWVNRHQTEVIEYLVEENRVLKEQLGGKRLGLNNDQRRWVLSVKTECIHRMILFGEESLRRVLSEYVAHLKDASYYLIRAQG